MSHKKESFLFIFALILGVVLAVGGSVWATTIGTNADISGTLSVSGASTLTGNVTASGTLSVTGASTLTGAVTASGDLAVNGGDITTTATTWNFDVGGGGTVLFRDGTNNLMTIADGGSVGNVTVTGTLTANGNTTLGDVVGDTTTFVGSTTYSNAATTTIAATAVNSFSIATSSAGVAFVKLDTSNYRFGIGTTTPRNTLSVGGDGVIAAAGSGTTTLSLQSNGTTKGGCIELETADGNGTVRIYAAAAATSTVIVESGSCR